MEHEDRLLKTSEVSDVLKKENVHHFLLSPQNIYSRYHLC